MKLDAVFGTPIYQQAAKESKISKEAMSETVLKILLSELQTVRMRCRKKNCGAAVEVPASKLSGLRKCPLCGKDYLPVNEPLAELADILDRLGRAESDQVAVEFLLPEKPATQS